MEVAAEAVASGRSADHLFLLEHPHVLTMGRRGGWSNLVAPAEMLERLGVERFDTDRGGDVTYHGPGQLVGYPIVRLREEPRERDVRRYVAAVEDILIATLADFGIEGATRGGRGREGVWVGGAKVAAVGVRIHRWTTSHGFALNVTTDLDRFSLIVPCGLPNPVTSMARLLAPSPAPSMEEVKDRIAHHAAALLNRSLDRSRAQVERESVQVVIRRGPTDAWLVLHRTPDRGDFDQPVTGLIDPTDASPRDAAAREVAEETGAAPDPADLIDLDYVHDFLIETWTRPGNAGADGDVTPPLRFCREHSYFWQAPAGARVRIAPSEHTSARWLGLDAALEAMRWSGNRRALRLASRTGP